MELIYKLMDVIKFENFSDEIPKGWVNIKLDQQLGLRMGRYVAALDRILNFNFKYNLKKKLDTICDIHQHIENPKYSIQTKISIITILQYMKELRAYFNPSSSGFLLEDFLAAIVHAKKVGGTGISDLNQYEEIGGKNKRYQIKLYDKNSGRIQVNMGEICDLYVICLKDGKKESDPIEIHILDGKNPNDSTFIGKFAVYKSGYEIINPPNEDSYMRQKKSGGKYMLVNPTRLDKNLKKITFDLGNLDELIAMCSQNIMNSVKETYDKLSELHYNIDSMVSGVDKRGKPINIDLAKSNADRTIEELVRSISKLGDDIVGG